MPEELLRVGDLAQRTGITVRTLHFYDEVGLLKPSVRSEGGHRLYGPSDLARLQRIVSLRSLGLTLEEIGDLLDGRETEPAEVLRRHITHLQGQIQQARALSRRLEQLAAQLESAIEPSVEDLLHSIQETIMYENYYTPEQLAELEKRRQALGEEGMQKAQQDWVDLIAAAKDEQQKGTPPDDPAVIALARRWQALIDAFTGGDPGMRESLQRLWRENQESLGQRSGVDPDLAAYMGKALQKIR